MAAVKRACHAHEHGLYTASGTPTRTRGHSPHALCVQEGVFSQHCTRRVGLTRWWPVSLQEVPERRNPGEFKDLDMARRFDVDEVEGFQAMVTTMLSSDPSGPAFFLQHR